MSVTLRLLKSTIYILIIAIGLLITWKYRETINNTITNHWPILCAIIILGIIQLYLQSINFKDLLETPSQKSRLEWLNLWALSSLSNYIAPFQITIAVRSTILKTWDIPIGDTIRATLRQVHLSLWSGFMLTSISIYFSGILDLGEVSLIGLPIALLWIWLTSKPLPYSSFNNKIKKWLVSIWHQPTPRQVFLTAVNYCISAIAILIAYNALGATINIADAMLVAILATTSALFSLLPGNIGIQELIFWYASTLLGLKPELAITIPIIFRISHISTCFLILILIKPFIYYIKNNITSST